MAFSVIIKMSLSKEGCWAAGLHANVRPESGVWSDVRLKISLLVEPLLAIRERTHEGLDSLVGPFMYKKPLSVRIGFSAARKWTPETLFSSVSLLVNLEQVLLNELFPTLRANKAFSWAMGLRVRVEFDGAVEGFSALCFRTLVKLKGHSVYHQINDFLLCVHIFTFNKSFFLLHRSAILELHYKIFI